MTAMGMWFRFENNMKMEWMNEWMNDDLTFLNQDHLIELVFVENMKETSTVWSIW